MALTGKRKLPLPLFGEHRPPPVQPAARHYAVHVRVQHQGLRPRVQHHRGGRFRPHPLPVQCKRIDGVPRRAEELAVHKTGGVHAQHVHFVREGEHHVEVRDGQQHFFLLHQPHFLPYALAFGAVAVAAGVVGDVKVPAGVTGVHVAAQGGGAAVPDGRQRPQVVGGQFRSIHPGQEAAHGIRQPEFWAVHFVVAPTSTSSTDSVRASGSSAYLR